MAISEYFVIATICEQDGWTEPEASEVSQELYGPFTEANADRVAEALTKFDTVVSCTVTTSSQEVNLRRVSATLIILRDEEYHVLAYDRDGNRLREADYFTSDADDARTTAVAMSKGGPPSRVLPFLDMDADEAEQDDRVPPPPVDDDED